MTWSSFVAFDAPALEAVQALRWGPLTATFILLSAWWVKGLVFAAAGALPDVRRLRLPWAALAVGVALGVTSVVTMMVKEGVDRVRPALAEPDIAALVATPTNPSFPSGHTSQAFAAAAALVIFYPRLRIPALVLAALVGLSRVYLGVHYWSDVVVGAAIGLILGSLVGWCLIRARRALADRGVSPRWA